jgi:hypothetical protein
VDRDIHLIFVMNLKTIKMQNLTVQQKSLVDSLVAEFTTLNNAKVVE